MEGGEGREGVDDGDGSEGAEGVDVGDGVDGSGDEGDDVGDGMDGVPEPLVAHPASTAAPISAPMCRTRGSTIRCLQPQSP